MKHPMNRYLPGLVENGILTQEKSDEILKHLVETEKKSFPWLFLIFGIIGAILIGLGIILIIGHNWDDFSKTTRTVFAFLPLVLGIGACFTALYKFQDNITWRESSAAFLFLATGACFSLVSQIYQTGGDMEEFLLKWMLCGLPLVYLMRSSVTSIFFIIGITAYGMEAGYGFGNHGMTYYWLLLLTILPWYVMQIKRRTQFSVYIHEWFMAASLSLNLATLNQTNNHLIHLTYIFMLSGFFYYGWRRKKEENNFFRNPFLTAGTFGLFLHLTILSFDGFWKQVYRDARWDVETGNMALLIFTIGLFLVNCFLAWKEFRKSKISKVTPMHLVFPLMTIGFFSGFNDPFFAIILVNILIFSMGVYYIRSATIELDYSFLNFGLIIISTLAACRFFDQEIPFAVKGCLFILIGISFFISNYKMAQKRRLREE